MFIPPDLSALKPELVDRVRRLHFSLAIHLISCEILGKKDTVLRVPEVREQQYRILPDNSQLTAQQTNKLLAAVAQFNKRSLMWINVYSLYYPLMHVSSDRADAVIDLLLPSCFYQTGVISQREFKEILMKEADFSRIPKDIYDKLEASLASVEQSLAAQDPGMKLHLRESHSLLISYPETVALLRDSEIATLIKAAEKHTQVEIIKAAASKKAGGKSGAKVTLDDI